MQGNLLNRPPSGVLMVTCKQCMYVLPTFSSKKGELTKLDNIASGGLQRKAHSKYDRRVYCRFSLFYR